MTSRILSQIALVTGVLLFSTGLQTFAAFTAPATAPPGADAYAPLHTGSDAQSKVGGLLLNTGGALNGLLVQFGNVGIGTTSPGNKLEVAGTVKASGYKSDDGTLGVSGNFTIQATDVASASQPHFITWTQGSPPGVSSPTGDFISNNLDDVFGWHCSPCTMPVQAGIDFGAGNEKTIKTLRVEKHVNPFNGFSVQGSNDSTTGTDGTWTAIFTGNLTQPSVDRIWQEFALSNSTAYRWYRLNITSQYGGGWAVFEWELLESNRTIVVKNGIVTSMQ